MQLFSEKYELHAVIQSTVRTGLHFKTTAKILHDGQVLLAELDNLQRPGITILSIDEADFEKHFAGIRFPVVICYKQL